jgi:phage FluMu protein Com
VLRIEGGEIEVTRMRSFRCSACATMWEVPFGTGRPQECPRCKSVDFHRVPGNESPGRGRGRRLGPCARARRPTGPAEGQSPTSKETSREDRSSIQ